MSQESISYLEASARFPQVRRPFADTVRSSPNNNILSPSPNSNHPKSISYKKTTFTTRRPNTTATPGYDHQAHRDIVREPDSQTLNGCALTQETLSPNDNLIEQLADILINIISRFSDTGLPNKTLTSLTQLTTLLSNNGIQADPETWLRPGSRFRVPGFACFRDDRNDGHGGAALFVSSKCVYCHVPLPVHSEYINVVAVRSSNITFVSVYVPSPTSSALSEFSSIISSLPAPLIILGDFNVHHASWGSHFNDNMSPLLLDLIDSNNLVILNNGSPTRRVSPLQNPKSAVDLSLCSPSISPSLSWTVLPSSFGSDHFPIIISMTISSRLKVITGRPRFKYKVAKADWSKFALTTDNEVCHIPPINCDNVHSQYVNFKNVFLRSADNSIPLKSTENYRRLSPPWWDAECTNMCRLRKSAERSYSTSMTMDYDYSYL
ncbi:unnamed protein product [Euphydryas editha]|uniref:Endonuclease/exonuclease/phosphatase domain-containing protein n=1 Tax=Euphydryas editha TaxID=104508 RepID=A0AAU9TK69_EUPED|nr:unnamed protein product [Euphydryas editha]